MVQSFKSIPKLARKQILNSQNISFNWIVIFSKQSLPEMVVLVFACCIQTKQCYVGLYRIKHRFDKQSVLLSVCLVLKKCSWSNLCHTISFHSSSYNKYNWMEVVRFYNWLNQKPSTAMPVLNKRTSDNSEKMKLGYEFPINCWANNYVEKQCHGI